VDGHERAKARWRGYVPSGPEALDQPFSAFPSWFLRITCDRAAARSGCSHHRLRRAHKCYAERAHYCEAVKGTYKG
jgi:hypothetical protein